MSSGKRTLIALVTGAAFGFSAALASGVLAAGPNAAPGQQANTVPMAQQSMRTGQGVGGSADLGPARDADGLPWQ